jgi:hypothetical protein
MIPSIGISRQGISRQIEVIERRQLYSRQLLKPLRARGEDDNGSNQPTNPPDSSSSVSGASPSSRSSKLPHIKLMPPTEIFSKEKYVPQDRRKQDTKDSDATMRAWLAKKAEFTQALRDKEREVREKTAIEEKEKEEKLEAAKVKKRCTHYIHYYYYSRSIGVNLYYHFLITSICSNVYKKAAWNSWMSMKENQRKERMKELANYDKEIQVKAAKMKEERLKHVEPLTQKLEKRWTNHRRKLHTSQQKTDYLLKKLSEVKNSPYIQSSDPLFKNHRAMAKSPSEGDIKRMKGRDRHFTAPSSHRRVQSQSKSKGHKEDHAEDHSSNDNGDRYSEDNEHDDYGDDTYDDDIYSDGEESSTAKKRKKENLSPKQQNDKDRGGEEETYSDDGFDTFNDEKGNDKQFAIESTPLQWGSFSALPVETPKIDDDVVTDTGVTVAQTLDIALLDRVQTAAGGRSNLGRKSTSGGSDGEGRQEDRDVIEALEGLDKLPSSMWRALASTKTPDKDTCRIFGALCCIFDVDPTWHNAVKYLLEDGIFRRIKGVRYHELPEGTWAKINRFIEEPISPQQLITLGKVELGVYRWLRALVASRLDSTGAPLDSSLQPSPIVRAKTPPIGPSMYDPELTCIFGDDDDKDIDDEDAYSQDPSEGGDDESVDYSTV